jgi:hypothetical protein
LVELLKKAGAALKLAEKVKFDLSINGVRGIRAPSARI